MKIGRTDLSIKHIQLLINEKEYFISFHYSLRKGIKDVYLDGDPAEVTDAYPAFPKLVKICVGLILIDIESMMRRITHKLKDHNRLDVHR